eukprot:Gb_10494 [translate_table: standard]
MGRYLQRFKRKIIRIESPLENECRMEKFVEPKKLHHSGESKGLKFLEERKSELGVPTRVLRRKLWRKNSVGANLKWLYSRKERLHRRVGGAMTKGMSLLPYKPNSTGSDASVAPGEAKEKGGRSLHCQQCLVCFNRG